MQGLGNYSSRMAQSQALSQPTSQQHVPGSIQPQTAAQPAGPPNTAVNQSSAGFSYAGHTARPAYEYRHMGPPPTAHHVPPLQAPMRALSSTIPTSQSFVNPLQRPLIPGSMPMPNTHAGAQQGSLARTPVVHQIRDPLGGPPWSDSSRNPPLPRSLPPPPVRGQAVYWQPANSQAMLLAAAQGVLHSVPGSSGSLVHSVPHETRVFSNVSSLSASSPSPLPLPSLPPGPPSSSSMPHISSKLHEHSGSEEKTNMSHGFGVMGLEPSADISGRNQMRSVPPVIGQGQQIDVDNGRKVCSFLESGSTDGATAPPKPTEEKVIQKIELLCRYIAQYGCGFEYKARTRESNNPEFKFLFGGEPGSEDAIGHDCFQWLKKKCCSSGRLPEGPASPPQPSEISSLKQPENMTHPALPDSSADSDMDMEDDITQLPEDEKKSKAVPELNCGPDLVQVKMDARGESHALQVCVDNAAPENALSDKFPSRRGATFSDQGKGSVTLSQPNHSIPINTLDEVRLDIESPGSAQFSPDGIIGKSATLQEDYSRSSVSEHADVKSPFRPMQEECSSDASLGSITKASHSVRNVETVVQSAAEVPRKVTENIEADVKPEIPHNVVQAAGQVFESTRTDGASVNPSQLGNELRETDMPSICGLTNETGDEDHSTGSPQVVATSEPFDKNSSCRSSTEHIYGSPKVKENKDHNFQSASTTLKVDEFGRLVREGVSDSDSDGSHDSSEYRRRKIIRGRGQPPGSRKRGGSSEQKWREKRSLSRSWSPRRRRSRSRSPRRRESRSRSPRRRRSRSRSPRRSRSRSPFRRTVEFRGDIMRHDRGRRPDCFHFLRGRCRRGASCRYSHHGAEIDGSSHKRRKTQITEMPPDLVRVDISKETHNNSVGAINQVDDEDKKQGSLHSLSMPDGSFDSQRVAEIVNLDNIENNRQIADQSQQSAVPDDAKCISTGIPHTTKFKQDEEIHGLLSVELCHPPKSDSDAMTNGKGLEIHYHMKSSSEPFQVTADVAVSAKPLPHLMDGSSVLKPSLEKNLTSSPVTIMKDPEARNFAQDQNVGLAASSLLQRAPQEAHLSSTPLSCTLNSMLAPDVSRETATYGGGGTATYAGYTHYQHSHVPLSSTSSQGMPKQYLSFGHLGSLRLGTSPVNVPPGERFVCPNLPTGALDANNTNPSGIDTVPPAELPKPSQVCSYPPQYGLRSAGIAGPLNVYPSDLRGINQPSFAPDHGVSGVTSHYNPYASTPEHPLVYRFGADILPQHYSGQYNNPQSIPDGVSGQTHSSMKSAAGFQQAHAQSGGVQYDPIFDSTEPPSNSIEKVGHAQTQGSISCTDVELSKSGSNKPMDVEENNKKEAIEAFIPSISLDDDGFGETADAEAGDVENASPSNHVDMFGEVETEQANSSGMIKSKESRSMKLFKIALANFVKEFLRPSWRQGNMSKEAFKTIVKKTVEKVTGTMKSHHIPKSQSKIDHYIESSQRKLTKLVMGYVDKYVKA